MCRSCSTRAGCWGTCSASWGLPIASAAPLARITDRFTAAVHRFADRERVPWVDFAKGQRKDDVMHEYLAAFQAAGRTEGVVLIGRAQEKTPLFRTEKRRDREGKSYPWIVKTTGMASHFSHHMIERIPRTHRYRVTATGPHTVMILTRLHDRVLPASLAQFTQTTGPPGRLRAAATAYQAAIDDIIHDAGLAA